MKVFKFGGASVKDAKAIKNVGSILRNYSNEELLVVVSAMGTTTNSLERIVDLAVEKKNFNNELADITAYHRNALKYLELNATAAQKLIDEVIHTITIEAVKTGEYDQVYDQVVSQGEILASIILNFYLKTNGFSVEWVDARKFIFTHPPFREGKVNWKKTEAAVQPLKNILTNKMIITQGFIGATDDGMTTTLGREGSDFSAAIFAACLSAESVTIWKDVPGVMSADPKRLPDAIVFEELPYQEAAEMTYYGASVIHPKTIKPLANAKIPLLVKNFDDLSLPGTRIHDCKIDHLPPLIVFKENQCLISCKVTDYTFVNEQQIGLIFQALMNHDIRINVMQNSAISFSICVDFRDSKIMKLVNSLSKNFEVYYNTGLTLITIKNYDATTFSEYRNRAGVILEQSSRSTLQVLVKN